LLPVIPFPALFSAFNFPLSFVLYFNASTSPLVRKGKCKGKVVPVLLTEQHAIKAYWGSGGITVRILWPRH